jgi:hypothetical protein
MAFILATTQRNCYAPLLPGFYKPDMVPLPAQVAGILPDRYTRFGFAKQG